MPGQRGALAASAMVGHGRPVPRCRRHDAVLVASHLALAAAVAAAPRAPHCQVHEHPHHVPQQLLLLPADARAVARRACCSSWVPGRSTSSTSWSRSTVILGAHSAWRWDEPLYRIRALSPLLWVRRADDLDACHALGTPRSHQRRRHRPLQGQLRQPAVPLGHAVRNGARSRASTRPRSDLQDDLLFGDERWTDRDVLSAVAFQA